MSSGTRESERRPRVLHITIGNEWAGVAAHLFDLLPGLERRGASCDCVLFSDGLLAERLREAGVRVHIQRRAFRYDPTVPFRLRRRLKRSGTQVLHMHGFMAIVFGCLASIGLPVERVVTLHQPSRPFAEVKDRRFRYSVKFAYRLARSLGARFIAVSDDVSRSYLENYRLEAGRVRVIRNGVAPAPAVDDAGRRRLREERRIPQGRPTAAIVGRLDPIKGHRYFLEAAASLDGSGLDMSFLVLGEGPLRAELERRSEELGLDGKVRFFGFRKDVMEFLAITDVLVIASDFEGLPYTLLQAMASGVPVVATRCEGLLEVLRDEVDALLVDRRAPDQLAQAVRRLIGDRELHARLSAAGRERIEREFGRDAMIDATIEMYGELLEAR